MTATPRSGEEEDFHPLMALPDSDRTEGRFRDGVHVTDTSDLMRRTVKEQLVKFDGKPLFPERRAYTVNCELSDLEAKLYAAATEYVREEMNRAESDRGCDTIRAGKGPFREFLREPETLSARGCSDWDLHQEMTFA